jgi:YD repeat-containing protein
MKNALGTEKDLELFNKTGQRVYKYYKDSDGISYEKTYDESGNELTYKDSDGFSYEKTYDESGNELTYKDSDGITRGFYIPEYTMEELVAKLGNFKIKR